MNIESNGTENSQIVAVFGSGRLVKTRSGQYRFEGGSRTDALEALEWTSMFFPELVFASIDNPWAVT